MPINKLLPYVDPNITYDQIANGLLPTQTIVDDPTKVHNHVLDTSYDDKPNTDRVGPFPSQTKPANKPSFWEDGYDPYTNNGSPSQGFLRNPPV